MYFSILSTTSDFIQSHWVNIEQKHINKAKKFKINKRSPLEFALIDGNWRFKEIKINEFSCEILFNTPNQQPQKYFFPPKTSQFIRLFNMGKVVNPKLLEIRGRDREFSRTDQRKYR